MKPEGAFYIYADISHYSNDSMEFCQRLLRETGVVVTPGLDFGPAFANNTIRISYSTGLDRIKEAMSRLEKFLANNYSPSLD